MVSASAGSQKSATTPKVSQSELGALSPGSPQDGGPRLGSLGPPAVTKALDPPGEAGQGPLLTRPGEGKPEEEERAADQQEARG